MTEVWKGIGKLIEEKDELGQLLGKLIPFPDGNHPDGAGDLKQRLADEIADLYAALDYFVGSNDVDVDRICERRFLKFKKFTEWGLTGIRLETDK